MPITVTHVNKNSSNRIHSFQSNNHINFNEEEVDYTILNNIFNKKKTNSLNLFK